MLWLTFALTLIDHIATSVNDNVSEIVFGLVDKSTETKVQVLTLCLSQETDTIVNNRSLTVEQKRNATAKIMALKHHINS